MIKSARQVSFLVRLGPWVCACLPKHSLDDELRARIRPLTVGWLACWCDRSAPQRG